MLLGRTHIVYRGQLRQTQELSCSIMRRISSEWHELEDFVKTQGTEYFFGSHGNNSPEEIVNQVIRLSSQFKENQLAAFLADGVFSKAIGVHLENFRDTVYPREMWPSYIQALFNEIHREFVQAYVLYFYTGVGEPFFRRRYRSFIHFFGSIADFLSEQEHPWLSVHDTVLFDALKVSELVVWLFQHYAGQPSNMSDVTTNPKIALWFATHKCTRIEDGRFAYEMVDWERAGVVYRISITETTETSGIYLPGWFRLKELPPYSVVLNSYIPNDCVRPKRQEAAGIVIIEDWARQSDLRKLMEVQETKVQDLIDKRTYWETLEDEFRGITTDYVFPPPEEDKFFAHLIKEGVFKQ